MNLKEALKALVEGKKIRRKLWNDERYICLGENGIIDNHGDCYTMTISDDSNFELYEEPKKPIDVLNKRFEEYRTTSNYPDYIMFEHLIKYLNEKENE